MLYLRLILLFVVTLACSVSRPNVAWLPFPFLDSHAADFSSTPGSPMPLYQPRKDSSRRARIGGQSRGTETAAPLLIPLVPDHIAFTIKHDPSLCWYLSMHTAQPVTVTVVDSRGIRPILEQSLPSPLRAGIHCTRPLE